jgi:MYXO-CTERM domain-containing protein
LNECIPLFRFRCTHSLRRDAWRQVGFALAASALFAAAGDARAAGEPCSDVLGIGDFDQGTTGWLTSRVGGGIDVYLVAAPEDRLGNYPSSKAGLVYDQSTIAGADYPIDPVLNLDGTCFGIPPGHVVRVGGWTDIPSGQLRTGTSQLALAWFPSGGCGPLLPIPFAKTQPVATPGGWTYFEETFVPPAGAGGVSVGMITTKNEAGGVFSSYYDDLYLCMPEPGGAPLGATAAVAMAGLAGWQRRRPAPPPR